MQRRYESDDIVVFEWASQSVKYIPVDVVYHDKNPRPTGVLVSEIVRASGEIETNKEMQRGCRERDGNTQS